MLKISTSDIAPIQIDVGLTPPAVYLNYCVIADLATEPNDLGRRFREALDGANGTFYLSWAHVIELFALGQGPTFERITRYLEAFGPRFVLIDPDPNMVVEREKNWVSGRQNPAIDEDFLRLLAANWDGRTVISFGILLNLMRKETEFFTKIKKLHSENKVILKELFDHERLTGKRAFEGETVTETLSSVLKNEPDWQALPSTTPPNIRFVLRRCLEKNIRSRFHCIGDLRIEIEEARGIAEAVSPGKRPWLAWSIAAALAVVAAIALWSPLHATRSSEQPLVRLDVDLGPDVSLGGSTFGTDAIISPEGNRLMFMSKSRLFTRRLDQPKAAELAGTEGANEPFFSPDSQWVAFFVGGKLKKISVEGGASIALCDTSTPAGGSWGEDGNIIAALSATGPLSRIPSAGGAPTPVTELAQGEAIHRWPQILPG